jgi:transposase
MSKSRKQGRPTLLNATLQKRSCKLLAEGCDQKTACNISGIGERTYHDWKERGRGGEEPYASFFSATSRVRDTHKARLIAVVMEAAHKDARHAEWLLERQFPKEFAPISSRDILASIGEPVRPIVNVTHLHDEKSDYMRRLADAYAKRKRAERDGQPFSAPDSKSPPPPPVETPSSVADASTVTDAGVTAKRWKTHALSGRAGQIPTSDM